LRFRYKRGGVEKLLTLGQYPEVSLKRAREKRDDARRQLSDGVDPTLKRRAEEESAANTFQTVADEWLMTKKHALTPATWARDRRQIYKWVVPYLGSKPIASIEAPDLRLRWLADYRRRSAVGSVRVCASYRAARSGMD
jgi:hypothetical protein